MSSRPGRYKQQNQEMEVQILARQKAERDVCEQKQARELAEQQAKQRDEKAAQRIRELEELLRTLQPGGASPSV